MEDKSLTRRRWFQFSLRTFLLLIMLIGFGCTWVAMQLQQKRRHEAVVNEIWMVKGRISATNSKNVPAWKQWLFGIQAVNPVELDLLNSHAPDSVLSKTKGMQFSYLSLGSSNVTDAELVHLEGMTSLERLELFNAPITDTGLSHLKGLSGLKILYLVNTQITDAGLTILKGMPSLEGLVLSNSLITDAGLSHLKEIANLQVVLLKNTQITDAGLVHLKGLTSLKEIVLSDTQITDAGLKHLQVLTSLKELDLRNTQVTDAGIDQLHKAIPGCMIHRSLKEVHFVH